MTYPDFDAVDEMVLGVFASHGFVVKNKAGDEVVDEDSLRDAVFKQLVEEHVVQEQSRLSKESVTEHELYEAIFPKGPGARHQPTTLEESEARKKLSRKLWQFTNTGESGYCQKRAEAEGFVFVLCEAKVSRTYRSEETGRPKPTTENGRFFTDNPELISIHSTLPATAKITRAAEAVAKHMQMTLRRHPELAPTISRQVGTAFKQAQAALGPVSDAKAALAAAKTDDSAASA